MTRASDEVGSRPDPPARNHGELRAPYSAHSSINAEAVMADEEDWPRDIQPKGRARQDWRQVGRAMLACETWKRQVPSSGPPPAAARAITIAL